jgi:hypothetical protein
MASFQDQSRIRRFVDNKEDAEKIAGCVKQANEAILDYMVLFLPWFLSLSAYLL